MQYQIKKNKHPKIVEPLSQDAVNALLNAPDIENTSGLKYATIMVFLYTTASRLDEMLSVKVGDLHLDNSLAHVRVIGKGRICRTLFIHKKLNKYLAKYIFVHHGKNSDSTAFLFFSKNKGLHSKLSEEGVNKQLKKIAVIARKSCADVPLDLHSHQFRHSAATHAFENNMSVFQISKMLGHKSVTTTMTYLGFTSAIREDAVKKMEGYQLAEIEPIWKGKTSNIKEMFGL
jgi:site-specific recombinase XerD